jgi:histidinol-phosphate aminotransferase
VPALIETLHKVRGTFNVGAVAQAAAAAAVADEAHERMARQHNTHWLAWLNGEFTRMGLQAIPSVCNFIVVRFENSTRCRDALDALARHGVLAMPLNGYGLPEAVRISVGTEAANRAVAKALQEVRR